MKKRLDELMVEKKLVASRSQARHLIKDGTVLVNDQTITKPGHLTPIDSDIKITRDLYVSRGAYKLEAAITSFKIDPTDKIIADIGASTGGFTEYLLTQGAKKIYAIDVGHDQLAEKLKKDPRVINLEGTNIRSNPTLPEKVDLCVVDLSFISLTLVLNNIARLLKPSGEIIALLKPQFEAGPNAVNEKGILSAAQTKSVLNSFKQTLSENKYHLIDIIPSPIKGKTGNQEYLCHIHL